MWALAVQLLAVLKGIKFGFLWDIGPRPPIEQVQAVVNCLNLCFPETKLGVLAFTDEICVSRLASYVAVTADDYALIDVSKSKKSPTVIDNNKIIISHVVEQLTNVIDAAKGNEIIHLKSGDICVPTLMGLLIGYPTLYYTDAESNGENCLSGSHLKVYQITFLDSVVSSFSVPETLLSCTRDVVNRWKLKMSTVQGVHLSEFDKTLDVVVL